MNVVVVESPAKAKTINKYLGSDYRVLASYGHVRDLPRKDGSVLPDQDFAMAWQVDERSEKQIKEITRALKGATKLYLATDPDREGEAISWHIEEILRQRNLLDDIAVERVVFHEITADAVRDAFNRPRPVNQELVDAYLARRALDYLVGFTLSPVLWRKLPGARSAGRVQSVALRLVCDREAEIEIFKPREYWSLETQLTTAQGAPFMARLTHLDGTKLDRYSIADETTAMAAKAAIEGTNFTIAEIERKRTKRNPRPPFTTSTLQQEASRKLGFGTTSTMRIAQRLYEGIEIGGETVGLITYMRTDSVTLSKDAISGCRALIANDYNDDYLPAKARIYKTKAKNAQEAHEAIRPTDLFRRPKDIAQYLKDDERRLYDLIWRRTIAAEMAEAQIDQVAVDLDGATPGLRLRATGSTIAFDGFLKVYREDRDDAPASGADAADDERRLPPMSEGEAATRKNVEANQHFTQPPPRYSEASLVKKFEEMGIGRPSTYASTLQVLQDRDYVVLEKRRFTPSDKGRLVTTFLVSFFTRYVEYDFTARMEEKLDEISDGQIDWKKVLREFWDPFSTVAEGTQELRTRAVIDSLDEELGPHFFPDREDGTDARLCPACSAGRLGLRLGRHGPFIGCSGYPECRFTRRLTIDSDDEDGADVAAGPKILGTDPESGLEVTLRKGPYGLYVQLGEPEGKKRPKRSSLPKGMPAAELTLETALGLLSLPRDIAPHPEDGVMIQAGIGRFGPYVKHDRVYVSLEADDEVLTIGINRAVDLIANKAKKRGGAKALREMGEHPGDKKPITLHEGRYGPYAKHGRVNATIPKDKDPATLTLEEAIALVDARATKGKSPRKATKAKAKPKKTTKTKATKSKTKTPKTTKSKAGPKAKAGPKQKAKAKPKAKPKTAPNTEVTETTTG